MNVFSIVPHTFMVPRIVDKKNRIVKNIVIRPGRNKVEDDDWEAIKERMGNKISKGHIRATTDMSGELNLREIADIASTPSKGYIQDLCAKSAPVPTGLIPGTADEYELVD